MQWKAPWNNNKNKKFFNKREMFMASSVGQYELLQANKHAFKQNIFDFGNFEKGKL